MPFDSIDKGKPAPFMPGVSHVIPNWRVTPAPVPAQTLRKSADAAGDRQQTVAGNGSAIPIIYGQDRVGGQYAGAFIYQSKLHLLVVWGVGEVHSLVSVEMNDEALPGSVTHNFHAGTAGQTVDTMLQSALAALGVAYTDALPYVCYSTFRVPAAAAANGFPTFAAVIKGLKVAATDGGTPAWSDNPVYCAADFVTSTRYGMGLTVDWATVATAAARCDGTIGSPAEKRRTLNLTMATVQPVGAWLDTLRAYCGCILNLEAGVVQFIPDAPLASSFSFTADKIVRDSLRLDKRGTLDVPTVVSVRWTNTGVKPYRDEVVTVYAAGVLDGTTPWRESQVPLPGINRYSQARREAIERINAFTLSDLTCQFTAFDPALKLQVGEVFDVTHPIGLTAKEFRAVSVRDLGFGRYAISGAEYDAAVYSDAVVTQSTTGDTTLPTPGTPPVVTSLVSTEDVYLTGDGLISSRVFITWAAPDYPFTAFYLVEIFEGSTSGPLAFSGHAYNPAFTSPALREGVTYAIGVTVISTTNTAGTRTTTSKALVGKTAPPDDVTGFVCVEAGGKVYAHWNAVVDLDPTITYELRYGSVGVAWSAATYVQKITALGYVIEGIAAGTWDFLIKAYDSYKHASTNATRISSLVVTLDTTAAQLGNKSFATPDLVAMTKYTIAGVDYWATENGDGWGYGCTVTDNATGTFDDASVPASTIFACPTSAANSSWVSEIWDFGAVQAATVAASIVTTSLYGSGVVEIGYAATDSSGPSYSTYTWVTGMSAKVVARFIRLRAKIASNGVLLVTGPVSASATGIVRRESGTVLTINAVPGVLAKLAANYVKAGSIQVTPQYAGGGTGMQATYDRVLVSPESGLMLQFDLSASGNVYQTFSDVDLLTGTGDLLKYDLFLPPGTIDLAATINVRVTYSDASTQDLSATWVAGTWVSVSAALTNAKTITSMQFRFVSTVAGAHYALIRDVRVTTSGGTLRTTYYASTPAEPTSNATLSSSNATNIKMGPANSFLVYSFDGATGAQTAGVTCSYTFEGT